MSLSAYGINKKASSIQIKKDVRGTNFTVQNAAAFADSESAIRIMGNVTADNIRVIGGDSGIKLYIPLYVVFSSSILKIASFSMPFTGYISYISGILYAKDATHYPVTLLHNANNGKSSDAALVFTAGTGVETKVKSFATGTTGFSFAPKNARIDVITLSALGGAFSSRMNFVVELTKY